MQQSTFKLPALWRQIQKQNFTCPHKLADFLELSEEKKKKILDSPKFVLNLPQRLAQKINKNTLEDPLFRQFVPLREEQMIKPDYLTDPVCDQSFRKERKILHKYKGRVLWLASSACAMHCRYCFRQNFPYETASSDCSSEISYLKHNPDIKEVILSGGDPLSLGDAALMQLFDAFKSIPHIQRIRFHTRFPIGIPERIDTSFLELLASANKKIYFVIHCNHPAELDSDVLGALQKIAKLGIPLLSQAVLLKGVNDDEETFLSLCETLIEGGILPYYVHLLDPVQGASHFAVPENRGRSLITYVQERLSGYGVPRLVKEEPGLPSKTFLF